VGQFNPISIAFMALFLGQGNRLNGLKRLVEG
jgi:hypothetical protein